MINYPIDELIDKTDNKYILSEVISQRARYVKHTQKLTIGYQAINQAIEDLMNDAFTYEEKKKR